MCNNNSDCKCISEILTVILVLQQNAECPNACLETCDRGFLGSTPSFCSYNTRPIMLYTCSGNGTPWSMPITRDPGEVETSNVFRIEKIDGCCATFRVLTENTDPTTSNTIPYISTPSFFTMNLNCVCSIRCLNDTFVENV